MRKADIKPGEMYAVKYRQDYGSRPAVKAEAIEVGIERDEPGRRGARKDGVRMRLCETVQVKLWMGGGYEWRDIPAGTEFVAASLEVERPWEPRDEAMMLERQARREQNARVREMLLRLGLAARGRADRVAVRLDGAEDTPGFELTFGGRVNIDTDAFEAWLKRIDPMEVAGSAIEAFVEAVCRVEPWAGLRDLAGDGRLDTFREAALQEMREGLAVSDAELTVADDGED
jgi:hypothetical protein